MNKFNIGDRIRRHTCNFGMRDGVLVEVGEIYTVTGHSSPEGVYLAGREGTYKTSYFDLVSEPTKIVTEVSARIITEEVCTRLVGLRDAHTAKVKELQEFREAFKQNEQILLGEVTEILELIVEIKNQHGIQ